VGHLVLKTAPTVYPVTLTEVKTQLAVASAIAYHDAALERLIRAATEEVQQRSGRTLLTTTWQWVLDGFPSGSKSIYLPMPPLLAVSSVTYVDTDGDTQTLSGTTDYKALTSREPGEVALRYNQTWPETYDENDVVTVEYTAGYHATTLPARCEWIKQAILVLVQAYWLRDHSQPFDRFTLAADRVIMSHRCGDEFVDYLRGDETDGT
jgi:uncharacterized phiE125 gp8 family phage protein